uniref:Uncharacterized protein n=1 Tax=Attheya septentrionalis TaxID=420275 RepID=A0A7S2U6T4_9STRA|mmetsp:Transcript_12378/g.22471  ORF Transcript_12378/g.22471 Transcript_12378/m.22471 type:complete len:135 (+) Transcript_12378:66-470(+)|eukprot:CAMPEP_0198294622 /NCGR_PEP_ID=MMETSP1449-20131203/23363_1 /TAXON_ID=420275 /ORGANISM="Attheya septentrionalis, Strain CCMP2084" /LENGTH=134 /DNA_ID=CAMNT_0043994627 /DNA_START=46 /DNA_END=450 /DNA_ORIENTATION=-
MSTALLHYGANERRAIMLEKLGGKEVLQKAVDQFYERQIHDERLMIFFRGTDISILKWHQFNLMSISFTGVPHNFDVEHLILNRHETLFDQGLNQDHFDMVLQHFSDTLTDMKVDPSLTEEALEIISPLRDVFL